jgi:hypothetical protein
MARVDESAQRCWRWRMQSNLTQAAALLDAVGGDETLAARVHALTQRPEHRGQELLLARLATASALPGAARQQQLAVMRRLVNDHATHRSLGTATPVSTSATPMRVPMRVQSLVRGWSEQLAPRVAVALQSAGQAIPVDGMLIHALPQLFARGSRVLLLPDVQSPRLSDATQARSALTGSRLEDFNALRDDGQLLLARSLLLLAIDSLRRGSFSMTEFGQAFDAVVLEAQSWGLHAADATSQTAIESSEPQMTLPRLETGPADSHSLLRKAKEDGPSHQYPFPTALPQELRLSTRQQYFSRSLTPLIDYLRERPGQRMAIEIRATDPSRAAQVVGKGFLLSDPGGRVYFVGTDGKPMQVKRLDALPGMHTKGLGPGEGIEFVVSTRPEEVQVFDNVAFAQAAASPGKGSQLLSPTRFASFLGAINSQHPHEEGRDLNCERCAITTAVWLNADPASATGIQENQPGTPAAFPGLVEEAFGANFRPASLEQISQSLLAAGPGAHGIVWLTFWDRAPHFLNAAVYRDEVSGTNRLVLIDAQTGVARAVSADDLRNPARLLRSVVHEQVMLRARSMMRDDVGRQLHSDFQAGRLDAVDEQMRQVDVNFMRVDGRAYRPPKSPAELRNEVRESGNAAAASARATNLAALRTVPQEAVLKLAEGLVAQSNTRAFVRHQIEQGLSFEHVVFALMSPEHESYGIDHQTSAFQTGWYRGQDLDRPAPWLRPLEPSVDTPGVAPSAASRQVDGFLIGGANSSAKLARLSHIDGFALSATLRQQLVADNDVVRDADLTHQRLAEPVKIARAMATDHAFRVFHLNGRRYMAATAYLPKADQSPFNRPDPFDPHNVFSYRKIVVVDLDSAQSLSFSELLPPLIEAYGVYATPLHGRVEPNELRAFFGL